MKRWTLSETYTIPARITLQQEASEKYIARRYVHPLCRRATFMADPLATGYYTFDLATHVES